ncbi:TetR/AcrR family transcriptional regulator [Mycobacterium sp.]|uniref:TetR/AcrR family transcriptional regulator n=1 Tax=Mycobacterium sp. TaxID=1785 RepID=UPI002C01F43A|nr:TetR/AcrR family transcriptional regulator [Mycobacterium sp.]HKP42211.1 TetR/AcrR family transcriptional regulator [Mycobacterium sp.]
MTGRLLDEKQRATGYGHGRQALLAAAIRVVADRGLRNLTYRGVAREAGVTHGLVTHHFGSRDALLIDALRYALENSLVAISSAPGTGRLEGLFDGLADMVEQDPAMQAFQYELILEGRRRPKLQVHIEQLYTDYRNALRDELRHGGFDTSDGFVYLVFAALDGLVFQQVFAGDSQATRGALEHLRKLLDLHRRQIR